MQLWTRFLDLFRNKTPHIKVIKTTKFVVHVDVIAGTTVIHGRNIPNIAHLNRAITPDEQAMLNDYILSVWLAKGR